VLAKGIALLCGASAAFKDSSIITVQCLLWMQVTINRWDYRWQLQQRSEQFHISAWGEWWQCASLLHVVPVLHWTTAASWQCRFCSWMQATINRWDFTSASCSSCLNSVTAAHGENGCNAHHSAMLCQCCVGWQRHHQRRVRSKYVRESIRKKFLYYIVTVPDF